MKKLLPVLTICCVLSFLVAPPVHSQTCGPPPEMIELTLSDGNEIEMQASIGGMRSVSMNTIKIFGDGYSVQISIDPEGTMPVRVSINNSDKPFDWGPGVIEIGSGYSSLSAMDEPGDLTVLPDEYAELWSILRNLAGELANNDVFLDATQIEEGETRENLTEQLLQISDGLIAPNMFDSLFRIQFFIRWDHFQGDTLVRGYSLGESQMLDLYTPSAPDDENPVIYLSLNARIAEDRWYLSVLPDAGICEFKWGAGDSENPISEEDWMPVFDNIRSRVQYYYSQLPALEAGGIIDDESELGFLLEKSLEGLFRYPVEIVYPE